MYHHVVTVLLQGSDNVVTIFSPTSGTCGQLQTVYLLHLKSSMVTLCSSLPMTGGHVNAMPNYYMCHKVVVIPYHVCAM